MPSTYWCAPSARRLVSRPAVAEESRRDVFIEGVESLRQFDGGVASRLAARRSRAQARCICSPWQRGLALGGQALTDDDLARGRRR